MKDDHFDPQDPYMNFADLIGEGIMWGAASIHKPDWFPSHSIHANAAWGQFVRYRTGEYAMEAITQILDAGLKLPDDLLPWVKEACDGWAAKKGNKVRVRSINTVANWIGPVIDMHVLCLMGEEIDHAAWMVAEKNNSDFQEGSLRTKYYDPKYEMFKRWCEFGLMLVHTRAILDGKFVEAERLRKNYTGFFTTSLAWPAFLAVAHFIKEHKGIDILLIKP